MSEIIGASPEISTPEFDRIGHLDALITSVDARLAIMQPEVEHLIEMRHQLPNKPPKSLFDHDQPVSSQLYDEPTYDDVFVYGYDPRIELDPTAVRGGADLKARTGVNFHEGEEYEGEYAKAILESADRLGFVKKSVAHASDPLDVQIGIADSELEPVGEVEAIIIPGARSFSNEMRMRDALRNLEQGRVQTDTIIIATTDRPVDDAEREKVANIGFRGGKTEFESLVLALSDLTNTEIDPSATEPLPVKLGHKTFEGELLKVDIMVAGKPLDFLFVSAPYDPDRIEGYDKDGKPKTATRASTDDTFTAALSLLKPGPGRLLIESHDTWALSQGAVAEQIFGIAGKEIIATGPRKLDRVIEKTDVQGQTHLALSQPEGVIDEIAKTYAFLTQTRIKAENERQWLDREQSSVKALKELGVSPEALIRAFTEPIPNMDELRARKAEGYGTIPIDASSELFNEPLVRLTDYDIAGQNYYSRPNATVAEPIPGVPRYPQVRRSVAETFDMINMLLAHPTVTSHFGGRVELYVEDGLRTTSTQARLHDVEVPALLKRNDPLISDAEMMERRRAIIAPASTDESRPSPHSTGGAADAILRYRNASPLFTGDDAKVWIGHKDGDTAETISPDYYEHIEPRNERDALARRNRRAFYAIMTGAAFNRPTGLKVNPTEVWHWSYGDQLWALSSGQPTAFYGPVKD